VKAAENPFAPGAGSQPPELAGRHDVISQAVTALERVRHGRHDRSMILKGLRGVGKTVLLLTLQREAEDLGYQTVLIEAPEQKRLTEQLVPRLRSVLVKLSRMDHAKDVAKRSLGVLRAFASAFKVSVGGVEIEVQPATGVADSGNLEMDLPDLLLSVGEAAQAAEAGVLIMIDELQYLSSDELSALIVAIHRIGQKNLPVLFFGAGLPQIAGLAGDAKSYAERLLRYPAVDRLSRDAAEDAIRKPLLAAGVDIENAALRRIVEETHGYPYFLQEWGAHAWNVAAQSPISSEDVELASAEAISALDAQFFAVRLDRLTPRETDYVRAMAELGLGPYRTATVAEMIGLSATQASPLRDNLIRKGMIYAPDTGVVDYTVPMFDSFMRRSLPNWTPAEAAGRAGKRRSRRE
jgi:hypothetical protein